LPETVQPRVADRVSGALVPLIEMFKAVPPQAPDDCQVKAVILRRDLRLAHEAGTAILHEATITPAGSILVDADRLDVEDRDRLLKTLLKTLIPGLHYAALAEESGLDIDRINAINEGLNA
jgi:hypothetical protein